MQNKQFMFPFECLSYGFVAFFYLFKLLFVPPVVSSMLTVTRTLYFRFSVWRSSLRPITMHTGERYENKRSLCLCCLDRKVSRVVKE